MGVRGWVGGWDGRAGKPGEAVSHYCEGEEGGWVRAGCGG